MEIDNKNSEEKEAKQPAEIPEKEKDHVLRTAVILATVIIVLGGIVVAVRLNNPKQDTTKGRKILSEMDRTDVGKVNKKIQKLEEEERVKEEAADNRSVSEKFADCLILGDSITQGLYEYGVLDEANVQADRGTEVSEVSSKKIEEHIKKAKEMKPEVLFLAYGMNDIEAQNGNASGFVKAYKNVIEDLKESLPDTKIYVNCILPAAQSAIETRPLFANVPKFNQKLKKLCKKEKVTWDPYVTILLYEMGRSYGGGSRIIMRKGRLDIINTCKYLMVIALIAYVVLLVSGEGDNTVSVDTIQKNIEKSVSLKGMKKGSSQDLKKYYGLNANDYAGTMLYIPDDVMSVNEILVVKVKDKSQVEDVEKAVEERLSTQKKSFEGYGVKPTRLLHSAIDETRGYYILLAVSKDADRIEAAFKNSIY